MTITINDREQELLARGIVALIERASEASKLLNGVSFPADTEIKKLYEELEKLNNKILFGKD